tara:strand:- start:5396 stop:7825 length:2430 start_codon:yes stop_codon:yes gene_type:complete
MAVSPSSVISASQGTGTFTSVNDAMGSVGSTMRSPATGKLNQMRSDAKPLDVTGQVDKTALEAAYGADGTEIWDTLQGVQEVSDGFTHCGDFLEDALLAATRDFIRNSGIQQAGRELSRALGQYDDMLDCAAGFATLLESEGVIDDAMGMGDLPQLSNRTRTLVEDITNASSVSNMLANCAVIRNLTNDFNNMCGEMMEKVNDLIGKDVAALAAALTKLAQWAAFAKMATSDPCALVNNNRMLQHVTQPVMEDIVKLYKGATGQLDEPEEPELPLADEVGKPPGTVIDVPKHKQAAMEGQPSFAQVADDLPVGTEVVEQQKAASPTGGYDSTPPEYVPGVGWTTPNDPDFPEDVEAKSDFSKGLEKGETPFNNSTESFKKNKDEVEYKAVAEDKKKVAKVHKVGWCTGGTNGGTNRNEDACKATDGEWHEKEMTDNEVKMAGSVEAAMGPIAKTLADVFPEYEAGPPPSSPSSALKDVQRPKITPKSRDVPSDPGNPMIITKERDALEGVGSFYGTWTTPRKVTPFTPAGVDPILSKQGAPVPKSSADPNDPKPFAVPTYVQAGLGVLPGTFRLSEGAALLPPDRTTQKSNIGGDISDYDQSREVVELAMKTGDWSQVETCGCEPRQAIPDAKEVGACDFSDLEYPNGYQLVPPENYTESLIAKVDAAEAAGTGAYIVVDDNIYESVEAVIMAQYGATLVEPFEPGKEVCLKHSGKWYVISAAVRAVSGASASIQIDNAKSKAVCEEANGQWVCKKGQAGVTNAKKAIQSYGKFTNKKNVNTRSKLPTEKPFDTDKLPSLEFSRIGSNG